MRQIEAFSRQKMHRACTLPTEEDISSAARTSCSKEIKVWLQPGPLPPRTRAGRQLVEEGHDPLEIAAAALKMARGDEKQRPIAADQRGASSARRTTACARVRSPPRDACRAHARDSAATAAHPRAGMVRLTLSAGRAHGIRPNVVVGTIAYHADIPGDTIGKIHIQEKHTLFDVPEKYAAQVLAKTGNYRIRQQPVDVERAR